MTHEVVYRRPLLSMKSAKIMPLNGYGRLAIFREETTKRKMTGQPTDLQELKYSGEDLNLRAKEREFKGEKKSLR